MVKWSDPLSRWMIAEENFSNNENNGAVPMGHPVAHNDAGE